LESLVISVVLRYLHFNGWSRKVNLATTLVKYAR
jgi:hypothetical protein